jgi:hypothetical protein
MGPTGFTISISDEAFAAIPAIWDSRVTAISIAAVRTRNIADPGGVAGQLTRANVLLLVAWPGKKHEDRSHAGGSAASKRIVGKA